MGLGGTYPPAVSVAPPPPARPRRLTVVVWRTGFAMCLALLAWTAFLHVEGSGPRWLVLLVSAAAAGSAFQSLRLFLIGTQLRRLGRTSRHRRVSLAFALVALLLVAWPYRPFTAHEQQVCRYGVAAAILAERDDDYTGQALRTLARAPELRYELRSDLLRAAGAADDPTRISGPNEATARMAAASRDLQLACGYRQPPM